MHTAGPPPGHLLTLLRDLVWLIHPGVPGSKTVHHAPQRFVDRLSDWPTNPPATHILAPELSTEPSSPCAALLQVFPGYGTHTECCSEDN